MFSINLKIDAAVRSGNIVRFGRGLTGILQQHPLYSRMALATPRAYIYVEEHPDLKNKLQEDIGSGSLSETSFAGFDEVTFRIFKGAFNFSAFGLCLAESGEVGNYYRTENRILNTGEGIHRQIFFGTLGIRTRGIDDLSAALYCKLVAKYFDEFHDARINSLEVVNGPLKIVPRENANGPLNLTFLAGELDSYPHLRLPKFL